MPAPPGTPSRLRLRIILCTMVGFLAVEFAEGEGKTVSVSDLEELGAALGDSSVGVIDLPEALLGPQPGYGHPPDIVLLDRSLVLRAHPNGTVWEQRLAAGASTLVAARGAVLRIQGVTFLGCEQPHPGFQAAARNYRECRAASHPAAPPRLGEGRPGRPDDGADCVSGGLIGPAHSLTPALQPPLLRAGFEGRVVLDRCQLVCNSQDAFVQTAAVVELLHQSGAPVSLERTGSTKIRVSYEGPANLLSAEPPGSIGSIGSSSSTGGVWELKGVVAAWDHGDCYGGGVAVASGAELQKALSDPTVARAHLLEPVSTSPEHWPSCGTRVERPVTVSGCGGTEWRSSSSRSHLLLGRGGSITLTSSGSRDRGELVFVTDAGGHHHGGEEEPINCSSSSSTPSSSEQQQQEQQQEEEEEGGHGVPLTNATDGLLAAGVHEQGHHLDRSLDWLKLPGWDVEPGAAVVLERVRVDMRHLGVVTHLLPPGQLWQKGSSLWFEAVDVDLKPLGGRYVFRKTLVNCTTKGDDEHEHPVVLEAEGDGALREKLSAAAPGRERKKKSAAESVGSSFVAVVFVVSGLGVLMLLSVAAVFASRVWKAEAPKDPGCDDIEEAYAVLRCSDHGNGNGNRPGGFVSWADDVIDRQSDRRESAGSTRASTTGTGSLNGIDDYAEASNASIASWSMYSGHSSVTCFIGKEDREGRNGRNQVEVFDQLGGSDWAQVYKGLWQGHMVVLKVYPVHLAVKPSPETEDGKNGNGNGDDETDEEGSDAGGGVLEGCGGAAFAACSEAEIAAACRMRHPHIVHVFSATSVPHRWMPAPALLQLPKASAASFTRSESSLPSVETAEEAAAEAKGAAPWAMHVIQEYCIAGSLRERLGAGEIEGQEEPETPPNLGTSLTLAYDAACGMAYLHRKKVVHGNLTSENVLLGMRSCGDETQDSFYSAKIADHSLRSLRGGCGPASPGIDGTSLQRAGRGRSHGAIAHLAPETLAGGRLLAASDVYAFGILLYELFTGKAAFEGKTIAWIVDHVVQKRQQPVFPAATLRPVVQLASRCMINEPEHRPSFQEIKGLLRELLQKHATDPSHGISSMRVEFPRKRSPGRAAAGHGTQPSATVTQTAYACSGSLPEVSCAGAQGHEAAPIVTVKTPNGPRHVRRSLDMLMEAPPEAELRGYRVSDPEAGDIVRNLQLGAAPPATKPKAALPDPSGPDGSAPRNAQPRCATHHERSPYMMLSANQSKLRRLSAAHGGVRRTSALMRPSISEEPEQEVDQEPSPGLCLSDRRMSLELPARDKAVLQKKVARFSLT